MKKEYIPSRLTVVAFKTERGYAASGELLRALAIFSATTYGTGDQNLEDRGGAESWSWD